MAQEQNQVSEFQSTPVMPVPPTGEHALDETIELPPSTILESIEVDVRCTIPCLNRLV
jgi:hypothetical protein